MLINEYRLNPATLQAQELIIQQMDAYFFGDGSAPPPEYVAPGSWKRATLALLFVVGLWSGCSVFMWQVAIQNFAVAERLAVSSDEGLRDAVNGLSDEGLRSALRYQASEVNRLFFGIWGWVQLPIAVSLLRARSGGTLRNGREHDGGRHALDRCRPCGACRSRDRCASDA